MVLTDRQFLIWIHERLVEQYGESPYMDYMHKLRAIITSIPEEQETPQDGRGGNDIRELHSKLGKLQTKTYPIVVLDWDYHTFDVVDDYGDILFIYDAPDSEYVYVEGWLWAGKSIQKTLYKRGDEPFKYVRHID